MLSLLSSGQHAIERTYNFTYLAIWNLNFNWWKLWPLPYLTNKILFKVPLGSCYKVTNALHQRFSWWIGHLWRYFSAKQVNNILETIMVCHLYTQDDHEARYIRYAGTSLLVQCNQQEVLGRVPGNMGFIWLPSWVVSLTADINVIIIYIGTKYD